MRYAILPLCLSLLTACGGPGSAGFGGSGIGSLGGGTTAPVTAAAQPEPAPQTLDPTPAPPPPPRARTAQQFDTTSAEDRAEALAVTPEPAGERELGKVVASLGSPADPGIWIKTPLVSSLTRGRVEVVATGKSANIELRPGDGGTQISLPAMRLLEIPLTDLPELILYAK